MFFEFRKYPFSDPLGSLESQRNQHKNSIQKVCSYVLVIELSMSENIASEISIKIALMNKPLYHAFTSKGFGKKDDLAGILQIMADSFRAAISTLTMMLTISQQDDLGVSTGVLYDMIIDLNDYKDEFLTMNKEDLDVFFSLLRTDSAIKFDEIIYQAKNV